MKESSNRTAVVTGGASGIGLGLAQHALAEGMHVIIADIEEAALDEAAAQLNSQRLQTFRCDVSRPEEVKALLDFSLKATGTIDLLFNNAGVSGGSEVATTSLEDWEWVLGVNLMGPIYVLHHFAPVMIKQNSGHIVNTASIAGMVSAPGMVPYNVSKHGVVTLSESLYSELRNADSNVGVSVLCPSYVRSNIIRSERNRPVHLDQNLSKEDRMAQEAAEMEIYQALFAEAMTPEQVAEMVFDGIANNRFYLFTHPEGSHKLVTERMQTILHAGNPWIKAPDFPS